MNTNQETSVLTALGLTKCQARVYITLIEIGPSKADEIAKHSEITRQDIYRIMPSLEQFGLVEKTFSRPIVFTPIPLQETLSILYKIRKKKTAEIKKNSKKMLKKYLNKNIEKIDENYQIKYIPGKSPLLNKTIEALSRAKKSLHSVSSWRNVFQHRSSIKLDMKFLERINRDIEVRFVIEKPEKQKRKMNLKRDPMFSQLTNLKIRLHKESIKAQLLIIDNKEVFIRIYPKKDFSESDVLWSNNSSLIAIAQSFFEKMWNESIDQTERIKIRPNKKKTKSH